MSTFWNFVTTMVSGTLAKADDVNTNLSGVDTGFTLVETEINKAIQVINAAGTTDIVLNAAARANKLVAFDENGDIAASQILGDWKGDHADGAGTDYEIRDVVKDAAGRIGQDDLFICNTTHTSTGTILTDTANWDLLVEVSAVAASAAAAAASETNAATSYDDFDDRYLGDKASDPALDNDGNALLTGALYFDTTLDRMKVYNGASWQLTTANAVDVIISDAGGKITATEVEGALQEIADVTEHITVTQAVNLDTMESNISTNNAKVTNATHTGDATGSGALTLQAAAITGKTALASGLAGTDELLVSDAGVLKRMGVSVMNAYFNGNLNFNNYSHPNHTGDVTSSGDGAQTLAPAAITGKSALASGLATTDELLISDAGTLKRMDVSVLMGAMYPVGSIYTSTVSTNPNTLFGVGTWSQIAAGRVLVGEGGGYTAGATAGSKDAVVVSHSHTTSETAHSHTIGSNEENSALGTTNSVNTRAVITNDTTNTTSTGLTVDSEGVSGTDANMMPYLVVYIWERTA